MNSKEPFGIWEFLPALLSGITIGIVGILGYVAGIPWLFPSLGPTIAIQSTSPNKQFTKPYNIFTGHMIGLAAGLFSVWLTGAIHVPSVPESDQLYLSRIGAATLAVFLSMSLQYVCKARHQPAEATTLLIALGALQSNMKTVTAIILGVILIIILGEGVQKILTMKKVKVIKLKVYNS